jgi:branched-chain amino acid transport system ATP-binding protein
MAERSNGTGAPAALEIRGLSAWYGEAQALRDVSLRLEPGEVVTLVGRNGAGKTTTLRSVMGIHRQTRGQVLVDGQDVSHWPPHKRARAGLGYVPDDRGVYATLSVEENLLLPPTIGPEPWSLERVYEWFPRLKERRRHPGTKLSGGEQQMLAIARVLRMGARVLLLDEPTEGLAPVLVQQIGALLRDLRGQGVTMLLIEQNLRFATGVAEKHHLLAQGRVVEVLSNQEVIAREGELLQHLGV